MIDYPGGIAGIPIHGPLLVNPWVRVSSRKQVRDPVTDWVYHAATGTCQCPFDNPGFIFLHDLKCQVALAYRAAENIQQASLHGSSRRSMICATSGPVEIRVIGAPISHSAFLRNVIAFSVS